MAKIGGLASGTKTIFQVGGAATKISRILYRVARKAGCASDDIHAFATDIGSFASIIGVAHIALRRHSSNNRRTPVLDYIDNSKALERIVTQSKRIVNQIEIVKPKIRKVPSKIQLWTLIKWMALKSAVEALSPKMEMVKTNLLVVINVLQLEAMLEAEPSPEVTEEMYQPFKLLIGQG
jgi:hypothetical protein